MEHAWGNGLGDNYCVLPLDELILKLYHPDFCSTHSAEYDISVTSCGACGYGLGIPYIYFLGN